MEVGEGADRHPHTIGLWFLPPALSHMRFIKLMNYEEAIKKLGVNEVSWSEPLDRVNHSTPVLAKN